MKQSVSKAKDLLRYGKECRSCEFHSHAFTVNDEPFYRCDHELRLTKKYRFMLIDTMPLPEERVCKYWQ